MVPPPSTDPDAPLLTLSAIRALLAEYEADVRLLAELPARVESKKRRLDAAMLFLPPDFDLNAPAVSAGADAQPQAPAEAPAASAAEPARVTWTSEMSKHLASLDGGISHRDLLAALKQTELGQREASPGEKGFYNAIAKLAEKGTLVKIGGLLYHKDVVTRLTENGQPLPDMTIEVARRAGGSGSLVVEVLAQHPKGLTAPALRKLFAEREDAPKSLREHGQYIYNILSTLMGNGTIVRRNSVYKLTKKPAGMELNGA